MREVRGEARSRGAARAPRSPPAAVPGSAPARPAPPRAALGPARRRRRRAASPLCRCRRHPAPPALPSTPGSELPRQPITASRQTGLQNSPPNHRPRAARSRQSGRGRAALRCPPIGWPAARGTNRSRLGDSCFLIGRCLGAHFDKDRPLPLPARCACAESFSCSTQIPRPLAPPCFVLSAHAIGEESPRPLDRLVSFDWLRSVVFLFYWMIGTSLKSECVTLRSEHSGAVLTSALPFSLASRPAAQASRDKSGRHHRRGLKGPCAKRPCLSARGSGGHGGGAGAAAHGETGGAPRGLRLGRALVLVASERPLYVSVSSLSPFPFSCADVRACNARPADSGSGLRRKRYCGAKAGIKS